jgi:hypothetical protein
MAYFGISNFQEFMYIFISIYLYSKLLLVLTLNSKEEHSINNTLLTMYLEGQFLQYA